MLLGRRRLRKLTDMGNHAYWESSLEAAMDAAGVLHLIPKEKFDEIVESLVISRENESLGCGYDCIPNPLETTVKGLERKRTEEQKEFEQSLRSQREKYESNIQTLRSHIFHLETKLENRNYE
jgi:hypothetical protein